VNLSGASFGSGGSAPGALPVTVIDGVLVVVAGVVAVALAPGGVALSPGGFLVTDYSDWNCLLERPPPLQRKAKLRVATRINAARFPPQNELVRHSASPAKTSQKLSEFHLANSYHEQYPLVAASDRRWGERIGREY
jgi:hypothetical protein